MKRYFIVVFIANCDNRQTGGMEILHSNLNVISDDGKFPKRSYLVETIRNNNPNLEFKKDPLIYNIMELSEIDWMDYNS